ncbi:hypothetical protein ACQKM1_25970 [Peribacillus frigoritolerans]
MEQRNDEKSGKNDDKFQELKIDPLGIGEKVRSHFRNFDKEAW